jgi:iron complex outermembrane receptor protein
MGFGGRLIADGNGRSKLFYGGWPLAATSRAVGALLRSGRPLCLPASGAEAGAGPVVPRHKGAAFRNIAAKFLTETPARFVSLVHTSRSMITSPVGFRSLRRSFRGHFLAACLAFLSAALASAAEAPTKTYNLPAADAVKTLKAFSEQSGEQIVYPVEQVRGVQTNAVTGELSARAALDRMLDGTGLVVVQDEKTGALAVRKSELQKTLTGAIKLEKVTVLGSRIRRTDAEGPSPVSVYDAEFIRATGAMTLADFMNYLPQNYTGIASGRASSPNEFNPEFGQRTESTTPPFNFVLGSSDAPPGQTGVSGVSLRGLGSGSTLVLVDGRRVAQSGAGNRSTDTRQGFVDLNTIPLASIDHIEVTTDGASAIYGADAVGGVINIVLKKDWSGRELNATYKASEHGGGEERSVSVTAGFAHKKISGTVTVEYYDRQSMKASQRSYSKNQNHSAIAAGTFTSSTTGVTTPLFGRDYRLNYGYPAVIQASGGVVAGNFDAIPGIRVVLVPTGATSTPTIAQFVPTTTVVSPATVVNLAGQRRANTAAYIDLIPKSIRNSVSGNLKYTITDRLEAYVSYRTSLTRGFYTTQPVTSITGGFGTAALLPAAFNPFNQNVTVGMVLNEFGSTSQSTRTKADSANGGIHGKFGETWQWDLNTGWQRQRFLQTTRLFNTGGFAALLTATDPAQRFNPFIDASAPGAPSQAALLETLAIYPTLETKSTLTSVDFTADGTIFTLPGGPLQIAFGGSSNHSVVDSTTVGVSTTLVPVKTAVVTNGAQTTNAVFAEASVPVFGKPNAAPLLRRLDLQLAGRYETNGRFGKAVPKYGISWSPVQPLLFRASFSQGFRAPGVTEYITPNTNTTSTLSDPLRTPPSTTGIIVRNGSNPDPKAEVSDTKTAGVIYEPGFVKGLSLQVNYYDTVVTDTLQLLSAQTIINNEALFPERVTRAAPTAGDLSLGQPGQITAVDRVYVNFGRVANRSLDFVVDYTLPSMTYGKWRASLSASRTLEDTRQLAPGQPAVVLEGDTGAPPKWKFNGSLFWYKKAWSASIFVWYLDGFESNSVGNVLVANSGGSVYFATPSVTKVDVHAGYEFKRGLWRGYGKGLRVNVGVNNLFDKEPPFSDTVFGYNGGIHSQLALGRSYEFSVAMPF